MFNNVRQFFLLETISTVTNPIVKPLWKHVGQPVTTHVCRPILQTITTVVTAVISLIWLLVWVPVTSLVKTLARALSWMFRGELLNTAQKGAVWMWEQLEYISWKFTTLDVWLFQRYIFTLPFFPLKDAFYFIYRYVCCQLLLKGGGI